MCIALHGQPLWLPELGSLAGFKVTEKRNGLHLARGDFSYPLHTLRLDPNAVWGDHDRCLHFAFDPQVAQENLAGDYGSHLLFCALPPRHFWSRQTGDGRCLHGDMTVPLACLTCGEGGYTPEILDIAGGTTPVAGMDPLAWLRQLPVVSR